MKTKDQILYLDQDLLKNHPQRYKHRIFQLILRFSSSLYLCNNDQVDCGILE